MVKFLNAMFLKNMTRTLQRIQFEITEKALSSKEFFTDKLPSYHAVLRDMELA